jgi:hypothetical protein
MKKLLTLGFVLLLIGCRTVRPTDLDAWMNVPVEALDTHSLFITVPVIKTVTDSGIEIRDYVNKVNVGRCFGNGQGTRSYGGQYVSYANYNAFTSCSSSMVGCDNIFYIKNGKVIEYKPVGKCFTDDRVRPEAGWERFSKPN